MEDENRALKEKVRALEDELLKKTRDRDFQTCHLAVEMAKETNHAH